MVFRDRQVCSWELTLQGLSPSCATSPSTRSAFEQESQGKSALQGMRSPGLSSFQVQALQVPPLSCCRGTFMRHSRETRKHPTRRHQCARCGVVRCCHCCTVCFGSPWCHSCCHVWCCALCVPAAEARDGWLSSVRCGGAVGLGCHSDVVPCLGDRWWPQCLGAHLGRRCVERAVLCSQSPACHRGVLLGDPGLGTIGDHVTALEHSSASQGCLQFAGFCQLRFRLAVCEALDASPSL